MNIPGCRKTGIKLGKKVTATTDTTTNDSVADSTKIAIWSLIAMKWKMPAGKKSSWKGCSIMR